MKNLSTGCKALLCLLLLSPHLQCDAGSVRQFNGVTTTGTLAFDSFGITVTTPKHEVLKLDLASILDASFIEKPTTTKPDSFPPGVFLTNGAFVAGSVRSLEEPTVKLGPKNLEFTISRDLIASILFTSLPRAAVNQIPKGKTGVLLPNGDFFSGTVYGLKKTGAVINSTLFGSHTFAPGTQVTALVLRDSKTTPVRYEVATNDGSRFLTNDLRTDHDSLLINDSLLGQMKISMSDLAGLRAGSWRYQFLTELRPVATGTTADPAPLVEGENADTLSTAVNVPVSYLIPPGFATFTCSIAVAENVAPAARLVFAVYADGKLVFKSFPQGIESGLQTLRTTVPSAQKLSLRVESATQKPETGSGKWIQPLLLRP